MIIYYIYFIIILILKWATLVKNLQGDDEQRCNCYHIMKHLKGKYTNTEEIGNKNEMLSNYNKDTSKSLKLIENDIRTIKK